MPRILVTGAAGQIGCELIPALRSRYGADCVVASDIRVPHPPGPRTVLPASAVPAGVFEYVDCSHIRQIEDVVRRHEVDVIYHLSGILSAVAEEKPLIAWEVNLGGLWRVLEVARRHGSAVFFPSSIGAFGPSTPRDATPQDTLQRPTSMYGVTKVSGELLCDYYAHRFALDTRGLRLPGLISHVARPGGGTTDYAVDMFYDAVRHARYTCFLAPETCLDMMYMPDALRAMIDLMEADPNRLIHRNAFNVTAMSLTPARLAEEIRKHVPDFRVVYEIDPVRQAIADSWPRSMDDSAARQEWDWAPKWSLEDMTLDMLERLRAKLPHSRS